MRRDLELEATIVEKYAAVEAFLDERGRRIWAAAESRAIGYGGDALVSDATGLSRPTIRAGRREIETGAALPGRIRRPGAGRPGVEQSQPGIKQALVNGAERSPIFGTIRCPIFCALSDSRPCGYPVAALPSSSFTGALSIPALRLLLSR